MTQPRAPFPWFGGKQALVPALLELLPPHDVYVEVFGGAASLLIGKRPSKLEIYNDLDSGLVNFFRVLRDAESAQRLQQALDLTPYSQEEWHACRLSWQDADDAVEMARRWYVMVVQGFSRGNDRNSGWSFSKQESGHAPRKFRTNIARLTGFTKRLALVQVDHRDFADAIALYDGPRTLFYADPPYVHSTRGIGGAFRHEMSDQDHMRLLDSLRCCAGMVVLSGYDSALYREALADWDCHHITTRCYSSNTKREPRTECIWVKPNTTRRQLTLGMEVPT